MPPLPDYSKEGCGEGEGGAERGEGALEGALHWKTVGAPGLGPMARKAGGGGAAGTAQAGRKACRMQCKHQKQRPHAPLLVFGGEKCTYPDRAQGKNSTGGPRWSVSTGRVTRVTAGDCGTDCPVAPLAPGPPCGPCYALASGLGAWGSRPAQPQCCWQCGAALLPVLVSRDTGGHCAICQVKQ